MCLFLLHHGLDRFKMTFYLIDYDDSFDPKIPVLNPFAICAIYKAFKQDSL